MKKHGSVPLCNRWGENKLKYSANRLCKNKLLLWRKLHKGNPYKKRTKGGIRSSGSSAVSHNSPIQSCIWKQISNHCIRKGVKLQVGVLGYEELVRSGASEGTEQLVILGKSSFLCHGHTCVHTFRQQCCLVASVMLDARTAELRWWGQGA